MIIAGVRIECYPELSEVVYTRAASGSFLGLRQRWKQQGGQYGDNRNDNQQLNQGECPLLAQGQNAVG